MNTEENFEKQLFLENPDAFSAGLVEWLASEEKSAEWAQVAINALESWREDGILDEQERIKLSMLEKAIRSGLAPALVGEDGFLNDDVFRSSPGAVNLLLTYLEVVFLALRLKSNLTFEPNLSASAEMIEVFSSGLIGVTIEAVAASNNAEVLQNFSSATLAAALHLDGRKIPGGPEHVLGRLQAAECPQEPGYPAEYASLVSEALKNMRLGVSPGSPLVRDLVQPEKMDRHHKQEWKKFYKSLTDQTLDQACLAIIVVNDEKFNSYRLVFGNKFILICAERRSPIVITRQDVNSILIGSGFERMHAGYSHKDVERALIDIHLNSGALYRFRYTISFAGSDGNSSRVFLTKRLAEIGKYYPVASSGQHQVKESGYRTRVSYGYRF